MTITISETYRITSDSTEQNWSLEHLAKRTKKDGTEVVEWSPWPRDNYHASPAGACVYALHHMPNIGGDRTFGGYVARMAEIQRMILVAVKEATR